MGSVFGRLTFANSHVESCPPEGSKYLIMMDLGLKDLRDPIETIRLLIEIPFKGVGSKSLSRIVSLQFLVPDS